MYLHVAGIVFAATALGLAAAPGAHAAENPGLAVSVASTDSDSTPDGPLQPGAPVEVTSGVDLTSLAVGENGSFTVTSPAFGHPVKVTMQKNSFGQGKGAIRCGIKPGSYPVDVAGHHEGSGLTERQTHMTVTVAGGGSYCDQASGSSAMNTTTVAAVGGGIAVLAVGAFAVARRRRSRTQP
jgi:MYXO-CTERM domain-containing protein